MNGMIGDNYWSLLISFLFNATILLQLIARYFTTTKTQVGCSNAVRSVTNFVTTHNDHVTTIGILLLVKFILMCCKNNSHKSKLVLFISGNKCSDMNCSHDVHN